MTTGIKLSAHCVKRTSIVQWARLHCASRCAPRPGRNRGKKNRAAPGFFRVTASTQLRSARIFFEATLVSVVVVSVVVVVVEPLAPMVLLLLLLGVLLLVSALEAPAAVLGVLPLVPAAGLLAAPVSPIGVDCVLCWPAPVAGFLLVLGGVL
jgi:hypothetical protein